MEKTVWVLDKNKPLSDTARVSYDDETGLYLAKIPGVRMAEVSRNYGQYKSKQAAMNAVKRLV